MDIQKLIRNDIWLTIKSTYLAENYTHSIIDGINFLSNIIREKSGLDHDGVPLVTKALGGNNPIIKLNKLETESEKNFQKGMLHIFMGLYEAIRNPRSHQQHEDIMDSQETADSILVFINYLVNIIDASRGSFVLDEYLVRIFDENFVNEKQYASLLANEIPSKKRFDTLISIYRQKAGGDVETIGLIFSEIFNLLSEIERNEIILIISDELKITNNETTIIYNLKLIPSGWWSKLLKVSQIRIENIIIKSLSSGEVFPEGNLTQGALATWARKHFDNFHEKSKLVDVFLVKILSQNYSELLYILEYFHNSIPKIITNAWDIKKCVEAISKEIINNEGYIRSHFIKIYSSFPDNWKDMFKRELEGILDFDFDYEIPF